MTAKAYHVADAVPHRVDAIEPGEVPRDGARIATLGETITLSIEGLKDFFFASWRYDLIDLLVIAAAVEYCDLSIRRPAWGWARAFDMLVAVHEEEKWSTPPVRHALEEALAFLTGDRWSVSFTKRRNSVVKITPRRLDLNTPDKVIMPYSDGLDSRAVAAIVEEQEKGGLVRVRLGSKGVDSAKVPRKKRRFATVPFEVKLGKRQRVESSARSRGFKFAVITGIAAQLAPVDRIVVTESGQGALGPVLASSGQSYPDYRVHPAFTRRIEHLFLALTNKAPTYEYPRIWNTKGETLAMASALANPPTWHDTRSCWQDSRRVSFEGERRQCGVCAACMLRRMSIHSAGIDEPASRYIWEDLGAAEMEDGVVAGFSGMSPAFRDYGLAGILHLDHLAALSGSALHERTVRRVARETADALGIEMAEGERALTGLLERHRAEWLGFLSSLGSQSFVARVAMVSPWH
ncbi:7-cyano-7-deazaguanine synthase in queuosine biosynthesis [Sphingomonas aurantiaca]|uniref:7-cyano-7-deazaguanine synthase in queuosine biosynthesis n=1 Tax=Sphingomonas aurantiaca TaxID=185949 RepID=A0A2T5GJC2_9SPHN|nr:7-cyano-7-deazaguanine synthase [Sphingomonas aurantiaca]PTQ59430.1 7-cyano-7-deazaguanine synthase in queuosine biosynthesis [Sphingomonas aurantiaca]